MSAHDKTIAELYSLPDSLFLPTLLDLIVHAAPDNVLGDGGSLYLKMTAPPEHVQRRCPGCRIENGKCERAYLVATTRDHPRARLTSQFYCATADRYVEAGQRLAQTLSSGPFNAIEQGLRESIKEIVGEERNQRSSSELMPHIQAIEIFKTLFCPRSGAASRITDSITHILYSSSVPPNETLKAMKRYDAYAAEFFQNRRGSDKGEGGFLSSEALTGKDHHVPLLRYTAALAALIDRTSREDNETDAEETAAVSGILWEVFRSHPLLQEYYNGYLGALASIRSDFPQLGLSGWSCAFGRPVRLRNIENAFEIKGFADKINESKNSRVPIPVWGDRARGHQDRLEREGRPFLVVPIFRYSQGQVSNQTLGFLRVATKREDERRFTEENEDAFKEYAEWVGRFVSQYLLAKECPNGSRPPDRGMWLDLFLYGAVKGEPIDDLGSTAAKCFRERFGAAAASLFLREDLWTPAEEYKGRRGNDSQNKQLESGDTGHAPLEQGQRRYLLWGTDADTGLLQRLPGDDAVQGFKTFQEKARDVFYIEGKGKTGWVLKHKAAVQAHYVAQNKVQIRLSQGQNVEATRTGSEWTYDLPLGIPPADPYEIHELIQKLCVKEQSQTIRCEIPPFNHECFLAAPLIDPDESPEPLGVVRLIFTKWPPSGTDTKSADELLFFVARLARGLSRLLRQTLRPVRLLRTFPRLVETAVGSDRKERTSSDESLPLERGVFRAGPYGEVAATLIELGEASAGSVFVRNEYAPTGYRTISPAEDTWVLVGAAASSDALTPSDRHHFRQDFCKVYLDERKGECRYRLNQGRTGRTIQERRSSYFEPDQEDETEKSEFVCEVKSPSALLIVPAPAARGRNEDLRGSAPLPTVVVRLVRTGERRRAKFLLGERKQMEIVVGALQWLVPAWSNRNASEESRQRHREMTSSIFSPELIKLTEDEVVRDAAEYEFPGSNPETFTNEQKKSLLDRRASKLPPWALSLEASLRPSGGWKPKLQDGDGVRKNENALLAWFLCSLEMQETPPGELVEKALRALLRIHWGPVTAQPWIDKLKGLTAFESVLAQLPRYRDHSIHQFQVFLIGWSLMRWIERRKIMKLSYPGWRETASVETKGELPDVPPSNACSASAWALASLFHDVAYPLETVVSWANLFGSVLAGQPHQFVNRLDPSALIKEFKRGMDILTSSIAHLSGSPDNGQDSSDDIRLRLEQFGKEMDHGVWAALVLLQSAHPTEAIVDAATAIALHKGMQSALIEKGGPGIDVCAANGARNSAFLPFLLALSDALHEWGRETSKDGENPTIDENVSRPRFTGMWPDKKKTITIDVALGQCTETALSSKIKELCDLAHIYQPGQFQIIVRVSQGDPTTLARSAVEPSMIVFCAESTASTRPRSSPTSTGCTTGSSRAHDSGSRPSRGPAAERAPRRSAKSGKEPRGSYDRRRRNPRRLPRKTSRRQKQRAN